MTNTQEKIRFLALHACPQKSFSSRGAIAPKQGLHTESMTTLLLLFMARGHVKCKAATNPVRLAATSQARHSSKLAEQCKFLASN